MVRDRSKAVMVKIGRKRELWATHRRYNHQELEADLIWDVKEVEATATMGRSLGW